MLSPNKFNVVKPIVDVVLRQRQHRRAHVDGFVYRNLCTTYENMEHVVRQVHGITEHWFLYECQKSFPVLGYLYVHPIAKVLYAFPKGNFIHGLVKILLELVHRLLTLVRVEVYVFP